MNIKRQTTMHEAVNPEVKEQAPSGRLKPLVRQVFRALKKTKKSMFWDVEPDEDNIKDLLSKCFAKSYSDREALEDVITDILSSHEDWLCGAVRDQSSMARRLALASLPNAPHQATASDGRPQS